MIYFVGHGQSTANAGGVTMAHADIPLSDLGRRKADLVAELLDVEPVLLLSSTYLRAIDTARPFSEKTDCPTTPHPLMHEFSALDAGAGGSGSAARVGSETFREFSARVAGFAGEMPHLPHDTVLFGHGIWFALLCWKLWGFSGDDANVMREFRRFQETLPIPQRAVYVLEQAAPRQWRLLEKKKPHAKGRGSREAEKRTQFTAAVLGAAAVK